MFTANVGEYFEAYDGDICYKFQIIRVYNNDTFMAKSIRYKFYLVFGYHPVLGFYKSYK